MTAVPPPLADWLQIRWVWICVYYAVGLQHVHRKLSDIIYIVDASCLCSLVKVFAKPPDQQEGEIFFYSMMFLVIAAGSGISMFLSVCMSAITVYRLSKHFGCIYTVKHSWRQYSSLELTRQLQERLDAIIEWARKFGYCDTNYTTAELLDKQMLGYYWPAQRPERCLHHLLPDTIDSCSMEL